MGQIAKENMWNVRYYAIRFNLLTIVLRETTTMVLHPATILLLKEWDATQISIKLYESPLDEALLKRPISLVC